jgi:hypothetical protein
MRDPIVEEVRRHRKQHATEHGNDLERIVADLREKEKTSGHKVVTRKPKLLLQDAGK